ncbi:MAG: hypothetical protein KJT03_01090 [Verrucomicrobiae bacterium]|nr:hypothetical protein [Verrucomicrobiae bacterium]
MFDFSIDRTRNSGTSSSLHCCFGMPYAAFAFGLVSVIAYSIWAFRLVPGRYAMFGAIAVVYLVLSGLAFSRLVLKPGSTGKFCVFFALAFLQYAFIWCLFWFGLKGKFHADLYGSVVGLAVMTWMFRVAFKANACFLPLFGVLFTCYTIGYYLGGEAHALIKGPPGMLLWGAGHGLGFGAGIGYLLNRCQSAD